MDSDSGVSLDNDMINNLGKVKYLELYDTSIINLALGVPDSDSLKKCCAIFEKATTHCMEKRESKYFQYGPPAGVKEIRSEIAKFLKKAYQSNVNSDDIFITSGATLGLHIITSTLVDLDGFVFIDELTYTSSVETIKQFTGLKIIPVKLNDDGVDVEALSDLLNKYQFKSSSKSYWGLYYTIAVYHNPTGILFSKNICQNLIQIARKFDILICCDDVYNILHYENNNVPQRLFAYDNTDDTEFKGNVISNATFSKLLSPGIRFGWLEAPKRCIDILEVSGTLNSGCLNHYTSGIMVSLFELGLAQSHISYIKEECKNRMLAAIDVLNKNLPNSCSFIKPAGGYFIWIRLPENFDANELQQICLAEHRIHILAGDCFSTEGRFKNCFRITISSQNEKDLKGALLKICKAMKEYIKNKMD